MVSLMLIISLWVFLWVCWSIKNHIQNAAGTVTEVYQLVRTRRLMGSLVSGWSARVTVELIFWIIMMPIILIWFGFALILL